MAESASYPLKGTPLAGVFPVLATPLSADGMISQDDFDHIIDFNLNAGVDGLVFPGNASEVGSLTSNERQALTEQLFARVDGRVPVVVGLSANDPDISQAMAGQAKSLHAQAVMIAPPAAYQTNLPALEEFLVRLAESSSAPLILQNAPPPLGPGLSAHQVAELMRDLPIIAYVKEECLPAGQRISSHLASASKDLLGVFGGAAGRFIMDELARGAIGTMPSCEIPEEHVTLMKAFRAGDVTLARRIYNRMVPLLLLTSVFKAAGVKSVLRMRGVIHSELCRDPASGLDEMDHRELCAILDGLGIEPNAATMNEGQNAHRERSDAR